MHGSKIAIRRKRWWLAVIVGLDGRTCERHPFPNRGLALKWIEGKALSSFKDKADRVELYNPRKMLIWSKSLQTK